MPAPATRTPITVTHAGGLKFAAQVRSHVVLTDQSPRAGGDDSAPSPLELIPVALAACIALYVHQFCESRGYPHEGMRVDVVPVLAPHPSRIAELAVTVRLPHALPAHAMEMLERVARSCPVHNTLAHATPISMAFETPAAEPSTAELSPR